MVDRLSFRMQRTWQSSYRTSTPICHLSGCVDHKRSAFIYVPWIDRSQGDKMSTAVKDTRKLHQVTAGGPGVRKLHQVRAGGPGVHLTRALACFCPKCIEGKGESDNLL